MTAEEYKKHFEIQLNVLRTEIGLFKDEEALWNCPKGISNSAGNLSLHLSGNLQYFIGTAIAKTNYERNRTAEFGRKGLSKDYLIQDIEAAKKAIQLGFGVLSQGDLNKPYAKDYFNDGHLHSTAYILNRLLSHLNYHIGQINYLRRFLN